MVSLEYKLFAGQIICERAHAIVHSVRFLFYRSPFLCLFGELLGNEGYGLQRFTALLQQDSPDPIGRGIGSEQPLQFIVRIMQYIRMQQNLLYSRKFPFIIYFPGIPVPRKVLMNHIIQACSKARVVWNERLEKENSAQEGLHQLRRGRKRNLLDRRDSVLSKFESSFSTEITEEVSMRET